MRNKKDNRTRNLAMIALMVALLEVAKIALQPIPNVELATFLFIMYTRHFGKKTYIVAILFAFIEMAIWGFGTWVIMYLYIWPILITIVLRIRNSENVWTYALLAGIYGVLFGAICSLTYLVIGGPSMALSWWIAGIPYDIIHGISNFAICLMLYRPVNQAMRRGISNQ